MYQRIDRDIKTLNIYVFGTSIQTELEKRFLDQLFENIDGMYKWSIDLSDWQRVLRVETTLGKKEITEILRNVGIHCKELIY